MIHRILIEILVIIVLSDFYFDRHYLRHRFKKHPWHRLWWWLPAIAMTGYTIGLASLKTFAPKDIMWLEIYLALYGIFVAPKAIIALCSFVGSLVCKATHSHRNYGNLVGIVLSLFALYVYFYGTSAGFRKLSVNHIDLYFNDLPDAFDGYRIAQFSDLHIGTYRDGRRKTLQRDIDSLNAQHADMIVFTGDLQNIEPAEAVPFTGLLSSLKARDGVYSVLGNHDYSMYIDAPAAVKRANERALQQWERRLGWRLLMNGHETIHRGGDSIVVAGEENDGKPPFPQRGDLQKTLHGVDGDAFVVLLQHDPTAWRRDILPNSNVQLTLSGHTHGGQMSILGWRPTQLTYTEDYGVYTEGSRVLYVSCGMGALIPFRFNMPAEIAIITLHKKQ